uniref:Uncharacterized protein n=1 Tax=Rhizophora mucronata TaxID=61149 RepID=A0A2P2PDV4_RHIMU
MARQAENDLLLLFYFFFPTETRTACHANNGF